MYELALYNLIFSVLVRNKFFLHYMSKKDCPIFMVNSLNINGQDFLSIKYWIEGGNFLFSIQQSFHASSPKNLILYFYPMESFVKGWILMWALGFWRNIRFYCTLKRLQSAVTGENVKLIMVLQLDGNSETRTQVRSNFLYLICLRHLIR